MTRHSNYQRGSNQYRKIPKPQRQPAQINESHMVGVDRAVYRFRATFDEHVWTAANREGSTFTLPEVRTLISGISVGGKSTHETEEVLGLIRANEYLASVVESGEFQMGREQSDRINLMVSQYSVLAPGVFRGEGDIGGDGGHVALARGGTYTAPPPSELPAVYHEIVKNCQKVRDPVERACLYFCLASRAQLYWDGNKRTSLTIANGTLLSHGYDAILIPATDRLEYNELLDRLFADNDTDSMMDFLAEHTTY